MTGDGKFKRVAVLVSVTALWLAPMAGAQAPAPGQPGEPNDPGVDSSDVGASPVRIETLELEPTVAKTGDTIYQTYRVRFPDLISEGREIIILEDRMTPENLPVHPFEGVSLDIQKRQVEDQHVWDFEYGLRLIAPEKALYVVPGFSFYYLVRDLGEDIEDAEVQQVDGGGNLVRYVTTITDVPVLDIRDTIELGSFQGRATLFSTLAWGVAPLPLLVWFGLLIRHARRPRMVTEEQKEDADELARIEAEIPVPPSIWESRRTLSARLAALSGLPRATPDKPQDTLTLSKLGTLQRDMIIGTREYLRAELPELVSGDTPKDMLAHVESMKDGSRRRSLQQLATRLVTYHRALERGQVAPVPDPAKESKELSNALSQLRPHNRLLNGIKGAFGVN